MTKRAWIQIHYKDEEGKGDVFDLAMRVTKEELTPEIISITTNAVEILLGQIASGKHE